MGDTGDRELSRERILAILNEVTSKPLGALPTRPPAKPSRHSKPTKRLQPEKKMLTDAATVASKSGSSTAPAAGPAGAISGTGVAAAAPPAKKIRLDANWKKLLSKAKLEGEKQKKSGVVAGDAAKQPFPREKPETKAAAHSVPSVCPVNTSAVKGGAVVDKVISDPAAALLVVDQSVLTQHIAMDCEMVGTGSDGSHSELARVTLVNFQNQIVLDTLVKPRSFVTDFRTSVSGIKPSDLRRARPLEEVQEIVSGVLKGRILVGHALHNDLKVLMMDHPRTMRRDTSSYFGKRKKLRDLSREHLGWEIQTEAHDSAEDAKAAMMLYKSVREEWEKSLRTTRKPSPVAEAELD
eukprot:ANDGO_07185.mRNA.1 RNA exonuclease 4